MLALADRVSEAVELALEDGSENGSKAPPPMAESEAYAKSNRESLLSTVRGLTEHQRLVCQHAVNTLNDMLDVAKIENGMYTPKEDVVDLGEICSHNNAASRNDARFSQASPLSCPVGLRNRESESEGCLCKDCEYERLFF